MNLKGIKRKFEKERQKTLNRVYAIRARMFKELGLKVVNMRKMPSEKLIRIYNEKFGTNIIYDPDFKNITNRRRGIKQRYESGFVYFILDEVSDAIKIGFAKDVNKRLSGLQTSNPNELKVISYYKGSKKDEYRLHYDCKDYNIRGEWFKNNSVVRDIFENHFNPK